MSITRFALRDKVKLRYK